MPAALRAHDGPGTLQHFEKLLIYAEADDLDALAPVIEFARRHAVQVTVCDVVETPIGAAADEEIARRIYDLRWTRAFERLRQLCNRYRDALPIEYTVLSGRPFFAVIEEVLKQRFDLVVHLAPAKADPAETGLDPTDMHLVRKCPCAVWTLRAGTATAGSGVALALDADPPNRGAADPGLNGALMDAAVDVARARGAALHLLHVHAIYGAETLGDARLRLDSSQAGAYLSEARAVRRQWFDAQLSRLRERAGDLEVLPHFVEGLPPVILRSLVDEIGPALLVMGTVGAGYVPGLLIGTTAEALLSRWRGDAVTLKPRGFKSPLLTAAGEG